MSPVSLIFDCLAFIATLCYANLYSWSAADVIWGLWITSLSLGFAQIFITAAKILLDTSRSGNIGASIAISVGFTAFFSFHFGMFHFVHGVFLQTLFPIPELDAEVSRSVFNNFTTQIYTCSMRYWPLIVAGAFVRLKNNIVTVNPGELPAQKPKTDENPISRSNRSLKKPMTSIYGSVVRMHILIIVLGFLMQLDGDRFALTLVLIMFFCPAKEIISYFKKSRKVEPKIP